MAGGVGTRNVGPGARQVHAEQAKGETETLENFGWNHLSKRRIQLVTLCRLMACLSWSQEVCSSP